MKNKIWAFIRGFAILYLMYLCGELLAHWLPLGIPASIWGLLLLFFGLTTQLIRVEWIFVSANLLIRYMAILFVPVSVGIMKYADLLLAQAKALLIPNLLSSISTLVIVGVLADYLFVRRSFRYLRHKAVQRRVRGSK